MGHERRIIPISELLQLDSSKAAKLCEEEVIAIVLYPGPMFQIYNTILRQYPEDKFAVFRDGDNLFSTTIFVLVSAVQKLSRCTRIPLGTQLYRGLGGKVDLPDIFFQTDDKGCSGYAEWGFLSTTSDRDVALVGRSCQRMCFVENERQDDIRCVSLCRYLKHFNGNS